MTADQLRLWRFLDSGGGSPFTPTSIAGLLLWLKADAGTYQDSAFTTPAVADADPVGGWRDQSGHGNHATQLTSTKRPTLKLAIQNGLPSLLWDGVDDFMTGAASGAGQPLAIFVAGKSDANAAGNYIDGASAAARVLFGPDTSAYRMYAGSTILRGDTVDASYHAFCCQVNGGASFLRKDGVQIISGNPGAQGYTSGLNLGSSNDGTVQFLPGSQGEILIYAALLTTPQIQRVEFYLKTRWGTP